MKPVITKEAVADAIRKLTDQGTKPTLAAIHAALGGKGSITTLVKIKAELESEASAPADSAEGLAQFRALWSAAVAEGRKQMETQLAELRAGLDAVTAENEKLEAAAIADADRVGDLQARLDSLVDELSQANRAATEARAGAADASQRLAQALADVSTVRAEYLAAMTKAAQDLAAARDLAHAAQIERATLTAQLEAERATNAKALADLEAQKHQTVFVNGKLVQTVEKLEAAQEEIKTLMKPKGRNTPKA